MELLVDVTVDPDREYSIDVAGARTIRQTFRTCNARDTSAESWATAGCGTTLGVAWGTDARTRQAVRQR